MAVEVWPPSVTKSEVEGVEWSAPCGPGLSRSPAAWGGPCLACVRCRGGRVKVMSVWVSGVT
eukprot:482068-Prymnesium_polylepis.1